MAVHPVRRSVRSPGSMERLGRTFYAPKRVVICIIHGVFAFCTSVVMFLLFIIGILSATKGIAC